ncbi:MAG: hypothetical protein LBS68_01145 [Puniceicoccales bacterium]|jgi:hypothetical protein|nr:hypothetical protein [Puniceicoccales bacterium]
MGISAENGGSRAGQPPGAAAAAEFPLAGIFDPIVPVDRGPVRHMDAIESGAMSSLYSVVHEDGTRRIFKALDNVPEKTVTLLGKYGLRLGDVAADHGQKIIRRNVASFRLATYFESLAPRPDRARVAVVAAEMAIVRDMPGVSMEIAEGNPLMLCDFLQKEQFQPRAEAFKEFWAKYHLKKETEEISKEEAAKEKEEMNKKFREFLWKNYRISRAKKDVDRGGYEIRRPYFALRILEKTPPTREEMVQFVGHMGNLQLQDMVTGQGDRHCKNTTTERGFDGDACFPDNDEISRFPGQKYIKLPLQKIPFITEREAAIGRADPATVRRILEVCGFEGLEISMTLCRLERVKRTIAELRTRNGVLAEWENLLRPEISEEFTPENSYACRYVGFKVKNLQEFFTKVAWPP